MQNPLEKYRSDHLFLLIGTNPLPNYVAAMLLVHPTGTLYLLHSDGSDNTLSTKPYAEFLRNVLKEKMPQVNIVLRGIHEADSRQITNQVNDILKGSNFTGLVGLNYTGGTKAMSVHTYRALAARFENVTFSYLDAHKLAMRIEQDSNSTVFPVAQLVNPSLKELATLHGYELKRPEQHLQDERLVQAITAVHATNEGFDQWRNWIPRDSPLIQLPDLTIYPCLAPVCQVFDALCGGSGAATPEAVAQVMGFFQLDSCRKWFKGGWLEELALGAIDANKAEFNIHDFQMGLELVPTQTKESRNFELDIAAMIGYQLFVISCIVSKDTKGETKKHLLEAFVRAQQLGGEEARVALVCCADKPQLLQAELEREWQAKGKIRVLGRKDLTQLPVAFADWFRRANL